MDGQGGARTSSLPAGFAGAGSGQPGCMDQQPATQMPEPDRGHTVDFDWLRHLVVALLVCAALVPVLHRLVLLGEDGNGWLVLSSTVVVVVAEGHLLRIIGLAQGVGLTMSAAGAFGVVTLVLVRLNLDIPGRTAVALTVAVPAVVLASLLAVCVVKWAHPGPSTWLGGFSLAFAVGFTSMFGPGLLESLDEAEDRFATAEQAEAAGLSAYLVEVDDWDVHLGTVREEYDDGVLRVVGYTLAFERDGEFMSESFLITVERGMVNRCDTADPALLDDCTVLEEGVAWVNLDSNQLVVEDGGNLFTVRLGDSTPDAEELAEAIGDRSLVSWHRLAAS